MKQLKVELLESALADIRETRDYIARGGGSRSAPRNYLARLERWCRRIGDAPGIGTARDDLGAGLRTVGFERSATIVFRVTLNRVEIVNVFFGGRDIDGFYRRRSSDIERV